MSTLPLLTICATAADGSQPFLAAFQRLLATPGTPARTGYWLGKLAKVFNEEAGVFNSVRMSLLQELGAPVVEQPGQFTFTPENAAKFEQGLLSLQRPVDLGLPDDLRLALPPVFTPADWLPIMAALDVFEEPK